MATRPPLSWPMMKDWPGVGAEVDLARHHLLHGEVAGGHREFLELDAVLLQRAGLQQIVGRHAPDVGLVALADGHPAPRRGAAPADACRQKACAGGEIFPSRELLHGVLLRVSNGIFVGRVSTPSRLQADLARVTRHSSPNRSTGRRITLAVLASASAASLIRPTSYAPCPR